MTSVVIVDDQDLVRAGLRALLTNAGSIDVLAEATDGRRGVAAATTTVSRKVVARDRRRPPVGWVGLIM